jgi:CheY-like chemotaxis protein
MPSSAQRILVVEDDDDVRESIAETVSRAGYEVSTARHGREALEMIEHADEPPSAVLLDLMMPVMDGWTFLSKLGDRRRQIPVVVMSAARDALLPAQIELLRKPIGTDQLLGALARRARVGPIPPKVDVVAYINDGEKDSERAIEILAAVMGQFEPDEIVLTVRKIDETPQKELDENGVMVAPTVIVRRPLPLRIAGPLQSTRFLTMLFDIAEVDRRRRT